MHSVLLVDSRFGEADRQGAPHDVANDMRAKGSRHGCTAFYQRASTLQSTFATLHCTVARWPLMQLCGARRGRCLQGDSLWFTLSCSLQYLPKWIRGQMTKCRANEVRTQGTRAMQLFPLTLPRLPPLSPNMWQISQRLTSFFNRMTAEFPLKIEPERDVRTEVGKGRPPLHPRVRNGNDDAGGACLDRGENGARGASGQPLWQLSVGGGVLKRAKQ
jgi:hypothetical protein